MSTYRIYSIDNDSPEFLCSTVDGPTAAAERVEKAREFGYTPIAWESPAPESEPQSRTSFYNRVYALLKDVANPDCGTIDSEPEAALAALYAWFTGEPQLTLQAEAAGVAPFWWEEHPVNADAAWAAVRAMGEGS